MIVLDACVLIAHLDADNALHVDAGRLLHELIDERFGASSLTLAEVLVGPARAGRLDRATAALALLAVQTIDFLPDAALQLALLREGTNLKLPDCCVLLAAATAHADIATFDDRLAAAATDLGFGVRGR